LRGVIAREKVEAEIKDLVAGIHPGRQSPDGLMLFKSVGAAIEDLTAARLVIAALSEAH
jgi:ornithine cyclodeaminase/alanine dehydrogenase-like protein (mu-crystallin family)